MAEQLDALMLRHQQGGDTVELTLNEGVADAWYFLGLAYNSLARYPEAIEAFNKTVGINPANALAYYQRAIAYLRLKKYRDAVLDFETISD